MKIKLPKEVELILNYLNKHNFAAYVVGGCIRDSLLGLEPKDWDITTSATPDEVKDLFNNVKLNTLDNDYDYLLSSTISTGEKFGTITIKLTNSIVASIYNLYEVTTFRGEGNYSDGRRPDNVIFGLSLEDDLKRRDFTINALAYNPLTEIIDLYNGQKDLENKIIKCVGNAGERFREDGLRILRCLRFAQKLNFSIDNKTLKALNNCTNYNGLNRSCLDYISKERIHDELIKVLQYTNKDNYTNLYNCNSIFYFLFKENLSLNNYEKIFKNNAYINYLIKLYLFLNDKTIGEAEIWLRTYKFSNEDIKHILNYFKIENYCKNYKDDTFMYNYDIKRLLSLYPEEDIKEMNRYINFTNDKIIDELILEPHTLKDLNINGFDLRVKGYTGEDVGRLLNLCLEEVLKDPKMNTKTKLLKYIKKR